MSPRTSKFLLGVTGFTLWVGPCSSWLKASLSPLNTLQLSQIQVSPVDPNGKHLLLKYQADWLCCLGEIIHQSLISGRRPKMAAPRVIALSVTHSVCWLRSSLWMVFSDLFCTLLSWSSNQFSCMQAVMSVKFLTPLDISERNKHSDFFHTYIVYYVHSASHLEENWGKIIGVLQCLARLINY